MGLSWLKDSARVHVEKVRRIANMLAAHGVPIETITTDRPGYVVYEDDYQIVAEPFSDTGA